MFLMLLGDKDLSFAPARCVKKMTHAIFLHRLVALLNTSCFVPAQVAKSGVASSGCLTRCTSRQGGKEEKQEEAGIWHSDLAHVSCHSHSPARKHKRTRASLSSCQKLRDASAFSALKMRRISFFFTIMHVPARGKFHNWNKSSPQSALDCQTLYSWSSN